MSAKSQNGYPANDISRTKVYRIPGTGRDIRLEKGDAGFLLVDLASKFHVRVEPIDKGQLDDWGYAERTIRGSSTELSNHASGTAEDLNAVKHPLGKRGTFTKTQEAEIHDLLDEYDGVIRWGGDYKNRADEMHFEIVGTPAQVAKVAKRIREAANKPVSKTPNLDAAALNLRASIVACQAAYKPATGTKRTRLAKVINTLSNELAELDDLRK